MMTFLFRLVTPAIIIFFSVGFICLLCSCIRIYRARKQLTDFICEYTKAEENSALQGIATASRYVFDADEASASHRDKSHLKTRIEAILDAVPKENGAELQAPAALPSLRDLHELTLQTEQSRGDAVALQTIISFLLILGILGTLTGVHNVVSEEDIRFSILSPALRPSILAVLFTVVLMLLRGLFYTRAAENYIAALDTFTMNQLLPKLSHQADTGKTADSFVRDLQKISEDIARRRTQARELSRSLRKQFPDEPDAEGTQAAAAPLPFRELNGQLRNRLREAFNAPAKDHTATTASDTPPPEKPNPPLPPSHDVQASIEHLHTGVADLQKQLEDLHSRANFPAVFGQQAPKRPTPSIDQA